MLRYTNTDIVFQELPDEVTLAVNLSGCPCRCPGCHSKNVDYMTRIIGYLKRVSNFSQARQEEASRRFYAHANYQTAEI